MNTANLALQQTPPLSVPLRFFLTAPLFGLLACGVLIYFGQDILLNRWSFATLTLTHLLTLGFMTMVMMGALLQLLPVLAGVIIPHAKRVSTLLHGFLTVGTLSLIIGFNFNTLYLTIGLWLLAITFVLFFMIIGYCLIKVVHTHITLAMRIAVVSLIICISLGLMLLSIFTHNTAIDVTLFTQLHVIWGLIGWTSLLIIGVAYQVVPMFQITPQYPIKITRWLVPILFILLLLLTLTHLLEELQFVISGLIAIGLSIFAITTLSLQKRRLRKLPDVTLNFWRFGMVCLLITVFLWLNAQVWSIVAIQHFYPILLGILSIGGFILSVIQGMLYKIVPFLIWLHLQNQQLNVLNPIQLTKIPNMKQIISDKYARYQFWIYIFSLFCLIAAIWSAPLIYLAATLLMISFSLLTFNLYKAMWIYHTISQQLKATQ